jgi:SAM-dependent methyltransferase
MSLSKTPESIKKLLRPFYYKFRRNPQALQLDPRWITVQTKLKASKKIVDLGCGNNPVGGATAAVDLYIEPAERSLGKGPTINVQKLEEKGLAFVNRRIDSPLPFADKEFDFAYSHHAFEHLDDPAAACKETMRIAKSGVIITPSICAELLFGRPYHRWFVMDRNNTIFFFRKRPFEDRPFGNHPRWDNNKNQWILENDTNPFDILLNDGNWYSGKERLPRLATILKKYWQSHAPVMEVIFMWEGRFEYKVYE